MLAEALNHVDKTRGSAAATEFAKNLRVYSISDQDDAGAWIRQRYPQLFYIVSIHGTYSCSSIHRLHELNSKRRFRDETSDTR